MKRKVRCSPGSSVSTSPNDPVSGLPVSDRRRVIQIVQQAIVQKIIPERLEEIPPAPAQPGRFDGDVRVIGDQAQAAIAQVAGIDLVGAQEQAAQRLAGAVLGAGLTGGVHAQVLEGVQAQPTDRVHQGANQCNRHAFLRRVGHVIGEDRARNARIRRVERDERGEGVQLDGDRQRRIVKVDLCKGIFAPERRLRAAGQARVGDGVITV